MLKKIAFISTALLILTACTTPTNNSQPASISTPTVSTSTTTDATVAHPTSPNPSLPTVSPVDQVAFNGAMQLKDQSYCDKISDASLKQDCINKLTASPTPTSPTATDCSTVSDPQQKQACQLQQQINAAQTKKDQDQQTAETTQTNTESQIIASGDLAKCKTLTLPDREYDCEMNILIPKAIAAKDIKVCQQASTPEITKACQNSAIIK